MSQPLQHSVPTSTFSNETTLNPNGIFYGRNGVGGRNQMSSDITTEHRQIIVMIAGSKDGVVGYAANRRNLPEHAALIVIPVSEPQIYIISHNRNGRRGIVERFEERLNGIHISEISRNDAKGRIDVRIKRCIESGTDPLTQLIEVRLHPRKKFKMALRAPHVPRLEWRI